MCLPSSTRCRGVRWALLLLLFIGACQGQGSPVSGDDNAMIKGGGSTSGNATRGEAIFRRDCTSCHTLGHGDERGPDLLDVTSRRSSGWLTRWLTDPQATADDTRYGSMLVDTWGVVMPDPGLDSQGIADVLAYIKTQSATGPMAFSEPVTLTAAHADATKQVYFERCAGCHGTRRAGATGPVIDQVRSQELGTDSLTATIRNGRPWGMPAWGQDGILTEAQVAQLAAFLQRPVPEPPAFTLADARATWQVLVAPNARPTAPAHDRDWENFFGVVLRDAGEVAIFDGDTKQEIARIDTGYAVHILRSSSTGRYFYAVGRDGWVTMIDLWASVPQTVARVRGCVDARSVESSKFTGYEDRFLIEGCYWPSQYVVFDGATLEPLSLGSVLGNTVDSNQPLSEVRVASIVASRAGPYWALALKESGHVVMVDYANPAFPIDTKIGAVRFLHDGGLDHTGRYFLVAANASNRMAVVDLQAKSLVTSFETGALPHPGRGANWQDPTYGWVNATTHMGEATLSIYGADPSAQPGDAWQVVREVALPSAGSLFLKTHPNSPWVLFDMTLSTDPAASADVCAYSKASFALDHCFTPAQGERSVHFEYDRTGSELWVSVWESEGQLVIYDSETLVEKARIRGLPTPTGKFNVYNTAHDVY
jgi:nitrite reductase (NO-forming) / hydroxylamine reductase